MAQPMAGARQTGRLVSALVGVALALFVLAIAPNAGAYTYESVVGDGCHESIVAEALRRARLDHLGAAPLPDLQPDDALLREDLPFAVADDMMDIGAIAMLIGVRDNDLKGRSGIDVEDLARVHGDPAGQRDGGGFPLRDLGREGGP